MLSKWLSIFLSTGIIFTIAACSSSDDTRPVQNESVKPAFYGDLDKKVSEIYSDENSGWFGECDLQWKDKAIEISRFLESDRTAIDEYYKNQILPNVKDQFTLVPMGPFSFKQYKQDQTAGQNSWTKQNYSWSEAYKDYVAKGEKINSRWVNLNSYVRGMVPDEEDRLLYGRNMGLDQNSEKLINAIYESIKICVDVADCTLPVFNEEHIQFFDQGLMDKDLVRCLQNSNCASLEKRRGYLQRLFKRVNSYKERYGFVASETAQINGNQLLIPMDLSVFGEDQTKFVQYVESVWNKHPDYQIKIVPQKRSKAEDLSTYIVLVEDLLGTRAFVDRKLKKMQLYNYNRIEVLAHEFGHVIGLPDNYYTTWNNKFCYYTDSFNDSNLMSNGYTGQVLPEHWDLIKKNYWNVDKK